jgi:CheY-like chemotaxis protein
MNKPERLVILVAEDDPNDFELLRRALPDNGLQIDLQIARDGEELIEYLRGKKEFADRVRHPFPDLIVLDLKMPRLNGLDVLKWFRYHADCARLPKIMLSGSSLEKDVEEAYRLGVNTFFVKPHSLKKLRELMRRVIDYWAWSERPEVHSG